MNNKKLHYAWWIMVSCMAMMFGCTGILVGTQGIFFRPVITDLGINASKFSFSITIGYIARAFFMPIAGNLLNKYNNRPLISFAIILHAGAFIAMCLYKSIYGFYISAVLMGIASSITSILAVPILINNWFEKKVGIVMGITMSFSGTGAAIMQYIGTMVINKFGWRTAYLALGLIALFITLPFTLFVIRTKPSEKNLPPYGLEYNSYINKNTDNSLKSDGQVNIKEAVINPLFYIMVIYAIIVGYIVSFQTHISNFASSIGVNTIQTGLVASAASIALIAGKFSIGIINNKFGIRVTTLIYSLFGVTSAVIGIISVTSHLAPFSTSIAIAICLGLFFAIPTTFTPIITRELFRAKIYSVVYPKIIMFNTLSMALGSTLNAILYDAFKSYLLNLIIIGLLSIITIFLVYIATRETIKSIDAYANL